MTYIAVCILFFLSGCASLVLEVTWSRQIGILFGHTVQGAAIVLASYFSGMTAGYLIGRRVVRSSRQPLRLYAACEIIAGLWALAIPFLLATAESSISVVFAQYDSLVIQTGLRAVFAFLLLMPATVAMGVTFPAIAAFFRAEPVGMQGKYVVLAYGINTAGAVAGTLAVTAVLMSWIGVKGASYVGAGLAGLAGAGALLLSYLTKVKSAPNAIDGNVLTRWPNRLSSVLAGFSGFATLSLQVLYTRLFSLVFHNSTYSFGTVVVAFLIALTASSLLFAKLRNALRIPANMAALQQTGGIAVALSMLVFVVITEMDYFGSVGKFSTYILSCAGLTLAIISIPITICGMLLPWTWLRAEEEGALEQQVASLTAINTGAAAAGSLITCFVMLPFIGLWASFALVAMLYILCGILISLSESRELSRDPSKDKVTQCRQAVVFAVIALGFVGASWKLTAERGTGTEEGDLVVRYESAYGWVDVIKNDESDLKLRQNVHYGLGSSASITMERRQGQIPILLHPQPKSVLFLGLATGTTAGAAADFPGVEKIHVVELIPDVVRAAEQFSPFNRNVLSNPKTTVFVNDGRHYLKQTSERYDVIISDLFVPWESMTGYLYTVEHYQMALKKLAQGGIFAQWIPLWQLGEKELSMIADSFASVFPYTSIFYGKNHFRWTILGLIGSDMPINVDYTNLAERLTDRPPPLPKDKSWFNSADELFDLYVGHWSGKEEFIPNTDDFPRVEFSTPVTAWTFNSRLRFNTLEEFRNRILNNLPMGPNLLVDGQSVPAEVFQKIRSNQARQFDASRE